MMTITEIASLLGLSKERTKQLVDAAIEKDPNFEIETGTVWKVAPGGVCKLLESRGISFPNRRVLTFAALKGGIGKTTLSINVASRLASFGAKVLLVDLDPEACATNGLISPDLNLSEQITFYDVLKRGELNVSKAIIESKYPNLDLVPSSLINHQSEKFLQSTNPKRAIKDKLDGLSYNFIFLELPPSFTALTGSAYLAADLIILPCTPNIYSLESVALTIQAIDELADEFECGERNYRILMNQYNPKRVASQEVTKALLQSYESKVFSLQIKESAEIANATNAGLTVFDSKTSKPIREDFHELAIQVSGIESLRSAP